MGGVSEIQGIHTLTALRRSARFACIAATAFLAAACTQTFEKREANYEKVTIERPEAELAEDHLVDVRIRSFEPGKIDKEDTAEAGLSEEIRQAEGYFAAVHLKRKMQQSGFWGSVRVVPDENPGDELRVSGKVLESDGEVLKLEVTVADATGRKWFTREYEGVIDIDVYDDARKRGEEPFEFLYTRISNDIALFRAGMEPAKVREIRQVAELRFAGDFAPDAFDGYVKAQKDDETVRKIGFESLWSSSGSKSEGLKSEAAVPASFEVVRLPAADDPMFERVRRIRARQQFVIDALDQYYESLARRIDEAYVQWRSARLMEMNAIRDVEDRRNAEMQRAAAMAIVGILAGVAVGSSCNGCASTGAAVGGTIAGMAIQNLMIASEQASADEKIHKAALEELGKSLETDVEPIVVEVEGETVQLQGTAQAKFDQWREVMKRLYRQEIGPLDEAPASAPAVEPAERIAPAGPGKAAQASTPPAG